MALSCKQLDSKLAKVIEDLDYLIAVAPDVPPNFGTETVDGETIDLDTPPKFDNFCDAFHGTFEKLSLFEDKVVSKMGLELVTHVMKLTTNVSWDEYTTKTLERFITQNLPTKLSVKKAKADQSGLRHLQDLVKLNHINDMLSICFKLNQYSRLGDTLSKIIANHLDCLRCLDFTDWVVDQDTFIEILSASATLMTTPSQRYYNFIVEQIPGILASTGSSEQVVSYAAVARDALHKQYQASIDEITTLTTSLVKKLQSIEPGVSCHHALQINFTDIIKSGEQSTRTADLIKELDECKDGILAMKIGGASPIQIDRMPGVENLKSKQEEMEGIIAILERAKASTEKELFEGEQAHHEVRLAS